MYHIDTMACHASVCPGAVCRCMRIHDSETPKDGSEDGPAPMLATYVSHIRMGQSGSHICMGQSDARRQTFCCGFHAAA